MLVPVSGDRNIIPVERNRKNTRKESSFVSFGEFLVERVEPADESKGEGGGSHPGRDEKQADTRGERPETEKERHGKSSDRKARADSPGDRQPAGPTRPWGQKIDLRA
ncbi:MAG: hypothetical protein U9N45_05900 [Gemmatimonadota bacterium]|nr:hypothetical protein [Gemmatimonadota bacterium]